MSATHASLLSFFSVDELLDRPAFGSRRDARDGHRSAMFSPSNACERETYPATSRKNETDPNIAPAAKMFVLCDCKSACHTDESKLQKKHDCRRKHAHTSLVEVPERGRKEDQNDHSCQANESEQEEEERSQAPARAWGCEIFSSKRRQTQQKNIPPALVRKKETRSNGKSPAIMKAFSQAVPYRKLGDERCILRVQGRVIQKGTFSDRTSSARSFRCRHLADM